ncbi:orotidine 5'-phosphate decarboxylase / HUMPS family protein [Vibrio metoecus]|uniref:orotidine 5'-phosphate decarboxylase / HUMPS family protein n=1 Tax=Vibrio metoecus TaxID=1481663 RepID=UPI00215CC9B6|nr:orotidine 5'-phosphate decarboxylase / HUMPS family protein [Vibrio metoecus]MCR9385434.1 orotidine 5'-phosphate decarboxylase [Vibrio metoecus]
MKLQLALDLLNKDEAISVVKEVGSYFDIIEVGTSLLKLYGINIVDEIKAIHPGKDIFLDAKIIDGPEREATLMNMSDANYYSMLAVATDTAVSKVLNIAEKNNAKVILDMQSVNDYKNRSIELKQLGVKYFCVHKNSDCGDDLAEAFAEFIDIKEITGAEVSIAGGINTETLPTIKDQLNPDIVVIGGAVLKVSDKLSVAQKMRAIADQ